jgi:hypothetical protein
MRDGEAGAILAESAPRSDGQSPPVRRVLKARIESAVGIVARSGYCEMISGLKLDGGGQ